MRAIHAILALDGRSRRRCALAVALVVALVGAACVLLRRSPTQEQAYSIQMHVNGSFSEGVGSIDSHSHEASDVGVDVIWWSDHDWRITSYRHVATFSFEDWEERLDQGEVWTAQFPKEVSGRKRWRGTAAPATEARAELTRNAAFEGERSLRIEVRNASERFAAHTFAFETKRGREKRPLASEITLHLAILPESCGPDGRGIVEVLLSEHPSGHGSEMILHSLHYYLENGETEAHRKGAVYHVPLAYQPNRWNRYQLNITRDAVRGFPAIHGEDNSLRGVSVGVESRNGKLAAALFDDFRIEQSISGERAFLKQARLIEAVARDHPQITQLQGVEASYLGPHINVFAEETELPDYDRLFAESGIPLEGIGGAEYQRLRDHVTKRIVTAVHRAGGLVSLNHPLGFQMAGKVGLRLPGKETRLHREEKVKKLLESRAYEADLFEVGYRQRGGHHLQDHLWLWDELARNGVYLVGTGVSDSHGGEGQRWRTGPNNFVSWVYARSPGKRDLIEGMRAGRVFFGDIVAFDGVLDLRTSRDFSMGRIVLTDRAEAEVEFEVSGLREGDAVYVVESGRRKGPHGVEGNSFSHTERIALHPEGATFVRLEVYDRQGGGKAFSNPITFVRRSAGGIPAARAGIDVGGVVSRSIEGISIEEFTVTRRGEATVATLRGEADRGVVELDWGAPGEPSRVEFSGMSGSWSFDGGALTLENLSGEGSLEITAPG